MDLGFKGLICLLHRGPCYEKAHIEFKVQGLGFRVWAGWNNRGRVWKNNRSRANFGRRGVLLPAD